MILFQKHIKFFLVPMVIQKPTKYMELEIICRAI